MSDRVFPPSAREILSLAAILRRHLKEGEDLNPILLLLERSIAMDVISQAFAELQADTTSLFDTEQAGYFGAAVAVSLDRDNLGSVSISVQLKEIDGGQLAFVLEVARRYELDVREESGWLRLSPHFIATDGEGSEVLDEATV